MSNPWSCRSSGQSSPERFADSTPQQHLWPLVLGGREVTAGAPKRPRRARENVKAGLAARRGRALLIANTKSEAG
jgi:hypothetical protein